MEVDEVGGGAVELKLLFSRRSSVKLGVVLKAQVTRVGERAVPLSPTTEHQAVLAS